MIARWFHRLESLGLAFRALFVIALFVAIVVADAATGMDLTLRALYLLPVGVGAWLLGMRAGISLGVLSAAVSTYFDIAFGLQRVYAGFVYSDSAVRLLMYLASAVVLVRLHEAQARLDVLSHNDQLTGLFNRRGFRRIAEREIERAKRVTSPLTIVHFDLDGFKGLNDALGHAAGDAALAAVGDVLRSTRANDVAARLGGDEFAILLPDTAATAAPLVVERLVGRLTEAMASRHWPVTFSVGVASFPDPPSSIDAMLVAADTLMYEVKRAGKAAVRYRSMGERAQVVDEGLVNAE